MKKFYLLLLVLLSVYACEKDPAPVATSGEGETTHAPVVLRSFKASIADVQTKAVFRPSTMKTYWEPGDEVVVDNGKDRATFVYNVSREEFVTEREDFETADTYTAVFPASAAIGSAGSTDVGFPSQVKILPGYVKGAPMKASAGSSGEFVFSHSCAFLQVEFPEDRLAAGNPGDIQSVTFSSEGTESISFDCSEAVDTEEPLWLLLPAKTYAGFNLAFTFRDGSSYSLGNPAQLTLQGGALTLSDLLAPWKEFSGGNGTAADPYRIACVADLKDMTAKMNADADGTYTSAHWQQTADIDMSSVRDFVPVKNVFKGVYDGGGHRIIGLQFRCWDSPAGFWYSAEDAEINGFNLVDAKVYGNGFWLGAIVGSAVRSTISGCSVSGDVTCSAKKDWPEWSEKGISADRLNFGFGGGLVGYSDGSNISNCTFSGRMMASGKSAGGIVSFADGGTVVDGCKVLAGSEVYTGHHGAGGIAGALSGDSVIRNCDTEGVVGAYGGWAGGVVGFMRNGTVSSCVVGSHSAINGRMQNCGGIAGSMQPASNGTASVDACSVYCDISGQYSIGGITGYIETDGTVRISNSAYIKGNLYSTGANTSFYNLVAGIAGWVRSGDAGKGITIRNCASIPSSVRTSTQNGDTGNASAYSIGGTAGLIGYTGSASTVVANCWSSFSMSQLRHCYREVTATAYPQYKWYGGLYGRNTKNVSLTSCYYDDGIQPRDVEDVVDAAECKAMSVQQMTDGTLLAALNSGLSDGDAQWVAGSDGWPLLSVCIADPDPVPARQIRVSVIGDSISTFSGYLPGGYHYHYPATDGSLVNVSDTYWYRLIYKKMHNAVLDVNMAYSATTVTRKTDPALASNYTFENSFSERYVRLGGIGNPDVVLIHGGTNDRGLTKGDLFPGSGLPKTAPSPKASDLAPLFETADAATTREQIEALDNTTFCTAYIKLIRLIMQQYPDCKIVCIIGDCVYDNIEASTLLIAEHYGAKCVNLLRVNGYNDQVYMPKHDYDGPGSNGCHPGVKAMHFIADKIYDELGPWMENQI